MNDTMGEEKNITYSTHCNVVHADEIIAPFFAGATNCTKDFMAVSRGMGVLWIFEAGWLSLRTVWLGSAESSSQLQGGLLAVSTLAWPTAF